MKILVPVLAAFSLALVACHQAKVEAPAKKYPLTGKVVSIDLKEKTAAIDAAAIPDFMDAMKMDYPISSPADLAALKVGENISAVVTVSGDGTYSLSAIHEQSSNSTGK